MFLAKWLLKKIYFNDESFLAKIFKFLSNSCPFKLKAIGQSEEYSPIIILTKFLVAPLFLKAIKTGEK
ncbi:MAG TPA: hypothetical protein DCR87_07865 [Acidobacteria bacterium]|nr:hypothetical protein [Acidobacteriota bacterium]